MTQKFSLVHIRKTVNTGDLACSPYNYFRFPGATAYDISEKIPASHCVIYGGGAIEPRLRTDGIHRSVDAKFKIAWGIGTSRSKSKDHGPLVDDLHLCGVREYGRPGGLYVPCVSCMSPLFDINYPIVNDIVLYEHASKPIIGLKNRDSIPTINNRATLADAIAFLASSEFVITNSFHGTYWSLLLGKKVLCLPFSSKFYGFKCPPTYTTPESWLDDLKKTTSYPEFLEECRERNLFFYNEVKRLTDME